MLIAFRDSGNHLTYWESNMGRGSLLSQRWYYYSVFLLYHPITFYWPCSANHDYYIQFNKTFIKYRFPVPTLFSLCIIIYILYDFDLNEIEWESVHNSSMVKHCLIDEPRAEDQDVSGLIHLIKQPTNDQGKTPHLVLINKTLLN